jgi:hypothetical protein
MVCLKELDSLLGGPIRGVQSIVIREGTSSTMVRIAQAGSVNILVRMVGFEPSAIIALETLGAQAPRLLQDNRLVPVIVVLEMHLADGMGTISRLCEHTGLFMFVSRWYPFVSQHSVTPWAFARQEGCPGGKAGGRGCVGLDEQRPFVGQTVKMRGL